MAAYVLAQLRIRDRARYERYVARFDETLEPFEGRLLAADESPVVVQGEWPFQKVVLIAFKDLDEAYRWAGSPAYREIAVDREASTEATILTLQGPGPWSAL